VAVLYGGATLAVAVLFGGATLAVAVLYGGATLAVAALCGGHSVKRLFDPAGARFLFMRQMRELSALSSL